MELVAAIANSLWTGWNSMGLLRFRSALMNPERAQLELLRAHVAQNERTKFGGAHRFSEIKTYSEFVARVPVMDYDQFELWITEIRRGEKNVLTNDPVTRLVPTSGSTAGRKLIPFTTSLQTQFNAAISAWVGNLYLQNPQITLGPAYWSITPAVQMAQGESAVPIGFTDDASYLGGARRKLINAVMAVPGELQHVTETETFQYLTLLTLLRSRELRLISVWHPSFLSLLLDLLPGWWDELLHDIERGRSRRAQNLAPELQKLFATAPMARRAKELRQIGHADPTAIWPHLKLISSWGDAYATQPMNELKRRFASTTFQPKGLLATEAFVTIPFGGLHPVAIRSHFFEFLGDDGNTYRAHELRKGAAYEVVVTTAGGLCRYRLRDIVEVNGFLGRTPSLRFLGRAGDISDRAGEKLSATFVARSIDTLMSELRLNWRFTLLAPEVEGSSCRYILFFEGDDCADAAQKLDTLLRENPHYAWCRDIGQLQPLKTHRVVNAYEKFTNRQLKAGKRLGDIKPSVLSSETDWLKHFQ